MLICLNNFFNWNHETKEVPLEEAFKVVRVQKLLNYMAVSKKPMDSLSGHYLAVLLEFLQKHPEILEEAEK